MSTNTNKGAETVKKSLLVRALCAALCLIVLPACALGEQLTLSFIGDCSIGEAIQNRGKADTYTTVLDEKGMDWPFSLVREYLDQDDFTFANLEVVFTERTKHTDKVFPLVGQPKYAQVLLNSGVDAVNTVNNHCFDYYLEGYQDTMQTLDEMNFKHFGSTYLDSKTRKQDVVMTAEVKGVKIGAIGFSIPQDKDLPAMKQRIEQLRADGCDLVIVSLHWGKETKAIPESWQFKYARKVIDLGADVLFGHGPHVLQAVQFYNGGVILYSTGNFTFGTMSSKVDRDTGILQVTYDLAQDGKPALSMFKLIPCTTTGAGDYRPYELTEQADRERAFKKLIYTREVTNMQNLPQSFIQTGEVKLENGVPVE